MANFVSYEQLKRIVQEIGHNFSQLAGAYTIKGNSTFANLPTPALSYVGFVYNVTDDFTTTSDFIEGAGKSYPAGTNVVIIDATPPHYNTVTPNGDENPKYNGWYETDGNIYFLTSDSEINPNVEKTYYTVSFRSNERAYKYDVIGGTVDLTDINDSIRDILGIIAPEFDENTFYSAGELVIYNNKLYKAIYNSPAGNLPTGERFTEVTIPELLNALESKLRKEFQNADKRVFNYVTSLTFEELPKEGLSFIEGQVFTITDSFTTTDIFIGGAGINYPAGTSVRVTNANWRITQMPSVSEGTNPKEVGLYVKVNGAYKPTADTQVNSNTTYYGLSSTMINVDPITGDYSGYKYEILGSPVAEPNTLTAAEMEELINLL